MRTEEEVRSLISSLADIVESSEKLIEALDASGYKYVVLRKELVDVHLCALHQRGALLWVVGNGLM